jgi:signal transduction histidine kinase
LLGDIERMTRIVNQLIEIAERDTLIVRHDDRADILEICTGMAVAMAPLAIAQGEDLALSGSTATGWITGSGTALFQAIRNLAENAITHTGPGTTVDIAVMPNETVNVSDEGPGIPTDQRELILQRLWQGDRRRTRSAGLGLPSLLMSSPCAAAKLPSETTRWAVPYSRLSCRDPRPPTTIG